jgi:orotidine-5'-phosphate decarboxylase
MASKASDPRIIVALDFAGRVAAEEFAARLDPERCRLKVGSELFTAAGPDLVVRLVQRGFDVFLDLKFHDIPQTVARACRAASALGVWMINVHASGGRKMLEAARDAIPLAPQSPLLIGVTVLTSLDDRDLPETGVSAAASDQALRLARLADDCGLDGVVCSAREAATVRAETGEEFVLVTPGIRPAGAPAGDQRRVATAAEAIAAGSDFLVVGRPVTEAVDAPAVLRELEREAQQAVQARAGRGRADRR